MKSLSVKSLILEFQREYYMYIPLTIILQSCIGSIAAMLILSHGTSLLTGIELTLCVITSMLYNAALLAQLKFKLSFWLLIVTLAVNSLLIVVNLLY